jgi:bis(5'-nucleosyl)-tetraphosphatase (symmetrical)
MRQWPPGQRDAPRWHTVYAGERRVVFGHDAIGGLVRVERDGGPWVVGLDSGCVYGGQLSGYLVEQDRLLQVPAARVYQPVT